MKATETRFQVGEWTPFSTDSVYTYTCRIYVVVMGQPLVIEQVCHSSLLCSTFAGAENASKTRAKGKENSGRKVAKPSVKTKGECHGLIEDQETQDKRYAIGLYHHLNASADMICRITLRYIFISFVILSFREIAK